ncbi:type II secretion system F family protein [Streptomyces triculaminicus]|uniref:Type II secretion system F family protein n=2 Tax=Streptomyces TaxID=1883 RepID=A0A939FRQ1_9ACTN|nr:MULTISPECIES: type II secretion system F family protein [Streptomyces]MBO0654790.1 type II secretion system F family protein [Streptomyces triculaminicus]QSY51308.1 type II secretion system F family protein [Streptomyces griseocarneus]
MDHLALLTVGATLLCGVLAVAGVRTYATGRDRHQALVDRLSDAPPLPTAGRTRYFARTDRWLRATPAGRRLELRIASTGLDVTVGEFAMGTAGAAAGLWLVAATALAPFFGPLAGLVAVWAAHSLLAWQRRKRIERFINQLPELSRILANATQAGLALRTALGMAAEEMEAPAGEELAKVADQLAVGHSIDEALGELGRRLPSRELVVLVTTLVLSHRAGGTVVSSLRNLTSTLEERKETRREVRTQLSQVTVTAYVVPAMGVGTLLLMDRIAPGSIERMTAGWPGRLAVVAAFGMYALGFFLIRRMSKIDV